MDEDHEPQPAPKMGFEGRQAQAQASLGDDLWEMHSAAGKIAEFTAGRHLDDYEESEMLRAVIASMVGVMAGALDRIAKQSPEQAARLDGPDLLALAERLRLEAAAVPGPEVWNFVAKALPALHARATAELEAWHQG